MALLPSRWEAAETQRGWVFARGPTVMLELHLNADSLSLGPPRRRTARSSFLGRSRRNGFRSRVQKQAVGAFQTECVCSGVVCGAYLCSESKGVRRDPVALSCYGSDNSRRAKCSSFQGLALMLSSLVASAERSGEIYLPAIRE